MNAIGQWDTQNLIYRHGNRTATLLKSWHQQSLTGLLQIYASIVLLPHQKVLVSAYCMYCSIRSFKKPINIFVMLNWLCFWYSFNCMSQCLAEGIIFNASTWNKQWFKSAVVQKSHSELTLHTGISRFKWLPNSTLPIVLKKIQEDWLQKGTFLWQEKKSRSS